MTRNWTIAAALGVALAACGSIPFVGENDERGAPPAPSVRTQSQSAAYNLPAFEYAPLSADAIRAHIERLASDQFEGRAPATRGETLTIDYVSSAFADAGLEPAVRDARGRLSWFQPVPLVTSIVTNTPALTIQNEANAAVFAYGTQQVMWTKRSDPSVTLENAELVFVGYGIVAPELDWNDYNGLDMAGKIAVILVNDPDFETGDDRGFRGRAMTYYGRWTYKIEEAARQGAAGALIVHESAPAAYPWSVVESSWTSAQHHVADGDEAGRLTIEGWVQDAVARQIFADAGLDFDAEKRRAQEQGFTPVSLRQSASATIEQRLRSQTSNNVVGLLRGLGRADEAVIYSAHWDHLGHCTPVNGDDICNGAMDNATGVAGLIEIARRFANNGRAQRSVLFIAFTAEESGLLGSAYYAQNPVFAPADTVAAINMDIIGMNGPTRDVIVIGAGQNELESMLAHAAADQGRRVRPDPYPERGGYFRSDHFSLARIGVPALRFSSGLDLYDGGAQRGAALNEDYVANRYHKPSDEIAEDWDYAGAMRDLLLLETLGRDLADSDSWPAWLPGSEFAARRAASREIH